MAGLTYLALDMNRGVHVLSLIGDTDAICGAQTGGHEFTIAPSLTSPARFLMEVNLGCRKCAAALTPAKPKKVRAK